MLKIIIPFVTVVSLGILGILLNITSPGTAGPFGILMIFIFAYISLIGVVAYLIQGLSQVIAHLSIVFISKKPLAALTFKRSYYYSTVVAAAPILMVGLQSVGEVGFYEFFLMLIFVVIGCLYVSKRIS